VPSLLAVLVATVVGHAPPPSPRVYDLATLTDAEARQLAGGRCSAWWLRASRTGPRGKAGGTTAGGTAPPTTRSGSPTATA
jgi:hypothetical protein